MSSASCPTPPHKNVKKMRNTAITLHILEMVLAQYLLPECTWDCVEECVGWCREVVVDPAPLRRIGREWMKRARGMRTFLEALFVRSDPERFCCGIGGSPHALAILLGEVVERDQVWRAEVHAQDPGIVFMELLDVPAHIWWVNQCTRGAGRVVRRDMEEGTPSLVQCGESRGERGVFPTLAQPQYAVRAAFPPVESFAMPKSTQAHSSRCGRPLR